MPLPAAPKQRRSSALVRNQALPEACSIHRMWQRWPGARRSAYRAAAEGLSKGQVPTPTLEGGTEPFLHLCEPIDGDKPMVVLLAWRLNGEPGCALSWFGRGVFRRPKKGNR